MLLTDSRTARALVTVLLFALALGFLYVARTTLIAFLFAIFFAYLMSPLVSRLEMPKPPALSLGCSEEATQDLAIGLESLRMLRMGRLPGELLTVL